MEFTRKQICTELKIQTTTFDKIIKYLSLKSEQKYHEKAHKIVDFFTEEQFNQIKQFLIDHPNKRALFLELTRIEKYGSLENFYAMKTEKGRKTKLERYGDEKYVNKEQIRKSHLKNWEENKEERIAQIKQTKKERYGDENYNNSQKNAETQIKNYGSVKEAHTQGSIKGKQTKLERYGNENYVNSEKAKQTKKEKYGDEGYNNREKSKETCLEKYGVEIPTQNEEVAKKISTSLLSKSDEEWKEIINKREDSLFENYGDRHYRNSKGISESWHNKSDEEIQKFLDKMHKTKEEKYGNPYYRDLEKFRNTSIEKYGVDNPLKSEEVKEKIRQTNLKNLGVEYPMQNKEVQEKSEQTTFSHYGVKHNLQSEEIKNQIKRTNLKKYGTEYASQNEDVKKKIKNTNNKKYGVDCIFQNEEIKKRLFEIKCSKKRFAENQNLISVDDVAKLFNKWNTTISVDLIKLNIKPITFEKDKNYYIKITDLPKFEEFFARTESWGYSNGEKELVDFIKSICDCEVIENDRSVISPKELDIYIPSKNLAIEYNGLHWHDENHVELRYHLNKTITCNEKGIDLIHVFEDDWLERKDIVKSMIASRLGIYQQKIFARKCEIKEIEKSQAELFFNKNHLQGFAQGSLYLGLFYKDELVQAIIINKKGWHDGNVELTRMTTKLNTQVIGGFSKLMKHISDYMNYESISSYVYRAWFNGKGYIESGFKIVKENPPSYSYIINGKRIHKSYFRKDKIKKLYENKKLDFYDESKTEHENMLENKIYRIYDCGTIKVIYENK